jgi:hypothetical protein
MIEMGCEIEAQLSPDTARFYQHTLEILQRAAVPHVLAGAYALAQYTGIARHTKDLDVFVKPEDRDRALKALSDVGYETEIRFPFWIAKAKYEDAFVDLIYRSPNGIGVVTDEWLARANRCQLLGLQVSVAAPEEILFCKIFILNNDRNDLADVMHLFHSYAERLNWERVLQLCDPYYRVLLSHMILFGFVYPSEKQRLPAKVLKRLTKRLLAEDDSQEKICNGSLLSHSQYKVDIQQRGFRDGRLECMTPRDILDATISADDQVKPEFAQLVESTHRHE